MKPLVLHLLIAFSLLGSSLAIAEEIEVSDAVRPVPKNIQPFVSREPGVPVKKADPCVAADIQPNSNPPTWDTPASTTQCGLVETDNLFIAQPLGGGVRQQMLVTTAKYGLTPHFEIRWGLPGRMFQNGGGTSRMTGSTDQWLGLLFRFHDQGRRAPDLALDYALKIPAANPAKGFGTGYTDHQLAFIASRDLGALHVDFNTAATIAGSPQGRHAAVQFGLALTRPLTSRSLATIEAFGGPQPGTTDRYGAVLAGGAYGIRPWLSLNAAYTRAYTASSPRQQFLAGFIYTLRPGFLPPRPSRFIRMLGHQ
ncbi:MAG TPA: hypothetical protein VGG85_17360 [Terracidiphilus sp.]|jgi:hypothetical protein